MIPIYTEKPAFLAVIHNALHAATPGTKAPGDFMAGGGDGTRRWPGQNLLQGHLTRMGRSAGR